MKKWWIRPSIRVLAAFLLPILVPAVVTFFVFALPGGPAEIICPVVTCGQEQHQELAEYYNIHKGSFYFFTSFLSDVFQGDMGMSWRVQQGMPISDLLSESLPNTLRLLAISMIIVTLGSILGGFNIPSVRWDPVLVAVGIVPVVVLSLLAAAVMELHFGGTSDEGFSYWIRLLAAAVTLGFADGVFSGAITGVRELFTSENKQRYVGVAILRGESVRSNTLPNIAGALSGQYRARILNLLSGVVIVEVIVGINGIGALLWGGTLKQDFGVVLVAATCFALFSSLLLLLQALVEILAAIHIRRAPKGVLLEGIA